MCSRGLCSSQEIFISINEVKDFAKTVGDEQIPVV